MGRVTLALAALLAGNLAVVPTASADAPDHFSIRGMVYAGSGCPAGTVANNISPDNMAFTLIFDSYVAEVGPGIPLSASRKNCQLNIQFDCPEGWSFALVDIDTRGYVSLDGGVNGLQKNTFYFQGDANQGSTQTQFRGPVDNDYHVRDTLPVTTRRWGLCGRHARALNINTQVRLDNFANRGGRGLMTVDSVDGSVTQVYGIVWSRVEHH